MTKAYKCDRCGVLAEGYAGGRSRVVQEFRVEANIVYKDSSVGRPTDLCPSCLLYLLTEALFGMADDLGVMLDLKERGR